jgi:iron complex outermembrane recepter protein
MKQNYIFTFMMFLLLAAAPLAAQVKVQGKVATAAGEGLIGVSILEKGTSNGTVSGLDGAYSINVASNRATLVYSYTGFTAQTVTLSGQNMLNITLVENTSSLDELVVVGSRGAGRTRTESAVPIDVISPAQIQGPSAKMDITSALSYAAPSFNYRRVLTVQIILIWRLCAASAQTRPSS